MDRGAPQRGIPRKSIHGSAWSFADWEGPAAGSRRRWFPSKYSVPSRVRLLSAGGIAPEVVIGQVEAQRLVREETEAGMTPEKRFP
ncbi:hypothetical protein HPP92_026740 [Vanilla planifolia]|uniref:Uncharacterized protein n=1 Tax=Vanilla planifolia TaxID=51239 RepID=A0A835PDI6_VANPL|nr:hypothetical protein HPP92_026740 [Vanilla planifolia]